MSTGSFGTASTAATSTPATRRTSAASSASASGCRRTAPSRGHDDRDDLLGAGGTDADDGGGDDLGQRLDALLDPDGGERTLRRRQHVHQPALDPQPALGVEVADVAGPVVARVAAAVALGRPEPVVALLAVVGGHEDLPRHPDLGGQRAGRPALRRRAGRARSRRPAPAGRRRRRSPGPAASISGSVMSATGSTSVIPYGVCSTAAGTSSWTRRSSPTGTGAPADISTRTRRSASRWRLGQRVGGGDHVAQRGRGGEDHPAVDGRRGVGERGRRERAGPGRVHVRDRGGGAHRRPVEGEQRERGHPGVVALAAVEARRAARPAAAAARRGRRRPWPGRSRRR